FTSRLSSFPPRFSSDLIAVIIVVCTEAAKRRSLAEVEVQPPPALAAAVVAEHRVGSRRARDRARPQADPQLAGQRAVDIQLAIEPPLGAEVIAQLHGLVTQHGLVAAAIVVGGLALDRDVLVAWHG